MKELLAVPDELAVAAVVALGRPVRFPRKLIRGAVGAFTSIDRFGGEPFEPSSRGGARCPRCC